jgi:hypothetical protein
MKAKVYKLTVCVVDFENNRPESIVWLIEGNRALNAMVMDTQARDVEWSDSHPLNKPETRRRWFQALFTDSEETDDCGPECGYCGYCGRG